MTPTPKFASEIERLMRDPDSMRAETEQLRRAIGRGRYDPNQPRMPAGNPKGGQWASKGYRGHSDRDARIMGLRLTGRSSLSLVRGDQQAQG